MQQNQSDWATATGFSTFNPTTDEVITNSDSREASKADVSNLSTFDPQNDLVSNVDVVNTTTTNTDMRGTDGSNTITPPTVSEIDAEITSSHGSGSWTTGSGGSTSSDIYNYFTDSSREDAFKADVSNLSTFDSSSDSVTTDSASRNASKADVSNLATQSSVNNIPSDVNTLLTSVHGDGSWQEGSNNVSTDVNVVSIAGDNVSSVDDFKADVSDLGTKANQEVINEGLKESSLGVPHEGDLPDQT